MQRGLTSGSAASPAASATAVTRDDAGPSRRAHDKQKDNSRPEESSAQRAARVLEERARRRDAKNALGGFPEEASARPASSRPASDTGQSATRNDSSGDDDNDEHWVLPPSRLPSASNLKPANTITVEPGWQSFLGQLASQDEDRSKLSRDNGSDDEDEQPALTARRSFGGWDETRKKKRKSSEGDGAEDAAGHRKQRKGERDDPPDIEEEEGKDAVALQNARKLPKGQFVKPGSLNGETDTTITNARKKPKKHSSASKGSGTTSDISAAAARKKRK